MAARQSEQRGPSERVVPAVHMEGVSKAFGDVIAIDAVDLELAPREVHGLLGGNGAGKTTLMNVLYGIYRADAGTIRLAGDEVQIDDPRDAIRSGVGMVHQNFLQVGRHTVTENIVLGTDVPGTGRLNLAPARRKITDLSDRFGLAVAPDAVVEDLPVGSRQRVEILKALYRNARILILDEPTTNLTPQEVDMLFGALRTMVDEGMTVVFITHKIREALAVCDQLSIMRGGRRVTTVAAADVTPEQIATTMVGEASTGPATLAAVSPTDQRDDAAPPADAEALLTIEGLHVRGDQRDDAVRECSFIVRRGELLGVAGVAGNGQVELAEALAGVRPATAGRVELDGLELANTGADARLRSGLVYIPENRHRDGILPTASVEENLVLGMQRSPRFRRGPLLDWRAIKQNATEKMADYGIRAPATTAVAATLSGGNIQRVILARAFDHEPQLLVAHNPTRGLDIHSAAFVHSRLRDIAARGGGVVLLSEDLDELIALSHRIIVLFGGRIVGMLDHAEFDRYELGRLMSGVGGAS